jgi:hypothetical protein
MLKFIEQVKSRTTRKLKFGVIVSLVFLICIFSAARATAQTGVGSSQLPNPIRIGVRDAAYPIAHDVQDSSVEGFCGVFGRTLENELNIDVSYLNIDNQYLDNSIYRRFDGLRIGAKSRVEGTDIGKTEGVDIECGPNSDSIKNTSVAEGIDFSNTSFYSTGIKFLLRETLAQELNQNLEALKRYKIGYVEKTSTPERLRNVEGLNLKGYSSRDQALDALELGEIQMYASDAIILRSLLKQSVTSRVSATGEQLRKARDPFGVRGYTIFPNEKGRYITGNEETEHYVIAIARDTSFHNDLKLAIDNVLNRPELSDEKDRMNEYENQSRLLESSSPSSIPQSKSPEPKGSAGGGSDVTDYLFQIILVIFGVFVQVLSPILPKEEQKKLAIGLGLALIVIGVLWFGYQWGSTQNSPK